VRMEQAAFSIVTVYLTVYGRLSSWYGTEGVAQNPHRNRHFSESQMSVDDFRGRVSQVRILPGPLRFSFGNGVSLGIAPRSPR
jgi:hypothetical protein